MGQVLEIDGITLVGTDDAGVLLLEDGVRKGCSFFSNGEKAVFEISGRAIEVCLTTGDEPHLSVRPLGDQDR